MKICNKCGQPNSDDATSCTRCKAEFVSLDTKDKKNKNVSKNIVVTGKNNMQAISKSEHNALHHTENKEKVKEESKVKDNEYITLLKWIQIIVLLAIPIVNIVELVHIFRKESKSLKNYAIVYLIVYIIYITTILILQLL